MDPGTTPMMKQYFEIKKEHPDSILFFRLGDFYEMFFDDAKEASRILHITLTARVNRQKKIPMCGVPHHAAENYIARLVKEGKKVAICEQTEAPSKDKKIVKRSVSKIITPGTFVSDGLLAGGVNQHLASLARSGDIYGLAYADVSTGEFRLTEIRDREKLFAELYKISPSETIFPSSFEHEEELKGLLDPNMAGSVTFCEDWHFELALAQRQLKDHFGVATLEGFGCGGMTSGISAAGALMKYLHRTQGAAMENIDAMSVYSLEEYMALDENSHRHLELVKNQQDLTSEGTLLSVLDKTNTSMGRRMLRRWLLNPLVDVDRIRYRQCFVQELYDNTEIRRRLREELKNISDLERLTTKVVLETANPRDVRALADSLRAVEKVKELPSSGQNIPYVKGVMGGLDHLSEVVDLTDRALTDNAPVTVREGGIIRSGYDDRVDDLRSKISGGKDWVAALQKKEIDRTGINSLKIGYNKVFGYYIEVTKANLGSVPEDYIRKQTLVNAERFITDDLKRREEEIIGAEEKIKELECRIFQRVRSQIAGHMDRLKKTAREVARLDVLSNFAHIAVENRYLRPDVDLSGELHLKGSRHPVLEMVLKDKEFVPNDVDMGKEGKIFIITGSNMAGKSTLIRQVALICLMAHIGSFVPASEARLGVVDRIFTRVGASDRLYKGMSTFMVEMVETANILNNATDRSLIVLDEIGRGTSTFDGVSIAWSIVEYLNKNVPGAKTMFATHYHELTELAQVLAGVRNYHLAVQRWKDDIVFLYKLAEGVCDESFGVQVAKMAGLPKEVVSRARNILDNLQKDSLSGNIRSRFHNGPGPRDEKQLDLFERRPAPHPAVERLKRIDPEGMTPIEALKELDELKKEVEGYDN